MLAYRTRIPAIFMLIENRLYNQLGPYFLRKDVPSQGKS